MVKKAINFRRKARRRTFQKRLKHIARRIYQCRATHVGLYGALWDSVGLCKAMYGYILLCRAMKVI